MPDIHCELQVLSCLSFLQQPGDTPAHQRWKRNTSIDLQLSQPASDKQATSANDSWTAASQSAGLHAAASEGAQLATGAAVRASGDYLSGKETVLVFAVHRFDRWVGSVGALLYSLTQW